MAAATLARGLSPLREVLDTGVVVLAQHNSTTPAVALNASFYTGTVAEPFDLPGTAFLAARTIDRGTLNRSAHQIAEMLDDRGVSLRVFVGRHTFTLGCVCLAEDCPGMLALIADIARQPLFPEDELEKRRIEAITSVRQDHDNTAMRASDAAAELLFGATHPYGRPIHGTIASLERIRRSDLQTFHRTALVPSVLRVAIVGDIDPAAAIAEAANAFGGWRGPAAPDAHVLPPPPPRRTVRVEAMPGKSQTDIVYGFTAVRRVDPRYHAYLMMNNVLGQFGLGGRLADNIRERQGMAYYAYSTLEATVGEGSLLIRAGVDPRNVARALDAIDTEVGELGLHGPRPGELEDTRESLIGSIPRLLETNESIADFLQTAEQFGLGLDYDRRLPGLLRQVTLEDVAEAAREVLDPSRAAVAIAGPHQAGDAFAADPSAAERQ